MPHFTARRRLGKLLAARASNALRDIALRMRQASDVCEHGLVACCRLRAACLASHGDQQLHQWRALGTS